MRTQYISLTCATLAGSLLIAGAYAAGDATKFAFSTNADPAKTRCAAVTGTLAATLDRYKCNNIPLSSGKHGLLCEPSEGAGGYMVFSTSAACESEREDEAAAE